MASCFRHVCHWNNLSFKNSISILVRFSINLIVVYLFVKSCLHSQLWHRDGGRARQRDIKKIGIHCGKIICSPHLLYWGNFVLQLALFCLSHFRLARFSISSTPNNTHYMNVPCHSEYYLTEVKLRENRWKWIKCE